MQKNLTAENFQKEVLENPAPVLVEFGADWSGACQMFAPVLEQLQEEFDGQIKLGWLDVEAHARTATAYGIQYLPTLLFFKQGRIYENRKK
jgi:thioredoxin 1